MYVSRLLLFLLSIAFVAAACGDDEPPAQNSGETSATCDPEVVCADRVCGVAPGCEEVECGSCSADEMCDDGVCACVPDCSGKMCGTDGCGGTCGTCSGDDVCNTMTGVCDTTCTPVDCASMGFDCEAASDGCGGMLDCGVCSAGACVENVCENTPPTFEFVGFEPPTIFGGPDLEIAWRDDDPDDDATIGLYWDTDGMGADGTPLLEGISEDDETDRVRLDVSRLPRGLIWIYAVIDDGSGPVVVYASAPLPKVTPACTDDPGDFTVDIETVELTVDITLDGAPISAMNTTSGDHGVLALVDLDQQIEVPLGSTWVRGTGATVGSFDANILPGRYDLILRPPTGTNFGGMWPDGEGTLMEGIEIDSDQTLAIDIPTQTLDVDVSIGGTPFVEANFPASTAAAIDLVSTSVDYAVTIHGGSNRPAAFPMTVTLLSGDYKLAYRPTSRIGDTPKTPAEFQNVVVDGQTGPVSVDIPTVTTQLSVLVNGADVAGSTSSAFERAAFIFLPSGEPFSDDLGVVVAPEDLPYSFPGVAGQRYDVYYASETNGDVFPSGVGLAAEDIELDGSPLELSIEGIETTITATLDGAPIDSTNTVRSTGARLEIRNDLGFRSPLGFFYDFSTDTVSDTLEAFLIPGDYVVSLATGALEPSSAWPSATLVPILNLNPSVDANPSVDIETARVSFSVTLDGAPVSSANTGSGNSARFLLAPVSNAFDRTLVGTTYDFNSMSVVSSFEIRAVRGNYELFYVSSGGSSWPASNTAIKTLEIDGDVTVPIDIETRTRSINFTLNGRQPTNADAVPTGNSGSNVNSGVGTEFSFLRQTYRVWNGRTGQYELPFEPLLIVGQVYYVFYSSADTANWADASVTIRRCFTVN